MRSGVGTQMLTVSTPASAGKVVRRGEPAGRDRRLHVGFLHVRDVGLAAQDGRGPLAVDVKADCRHPGAGECHDERQAHVAEPDDADAHLARGKALEQGDRPRRESMQHRRAVATNQRGWERDGLPRGPAGGSGGWRR